MIITLKGGDKEIVLDERDFSYILEKHLGNEVREYFDSFLFSKQSEIEELQSTVDNLNEELSDFYNQLY